jgi:Polyketide cyclase / dehydrase and lipid transport
MRVVQAARVFEGSVSDAEALWYDTSRWPRWVVGLAEVERVSAPWPEVGGEARWQSGPAGRGRVSERVVSYEALSGQTVEVEDDSIRGTQTVSFTPDDDNVAVTLSLSYELKRRSPLLRLVDLLFIRRAMTRSLEQTLARFGAELGAARRPDVG